MKRGQIGKLVFVALGAFVWCVLMFGVIPRGEIERAVEVLIPSADVPVDSELLSRYFEDKTQFESVGLDQYLANSPPAVSRYWFAQPGSRRSATVTYLAESWEGRCLVASKKYDLPEVGFYAVVAAHLEDGQLILKTRTDIAKMFEMGIVFAILEGALLWWLQGLAKWLASRLLGFANT